MNPWAKAIMTDYWTSPPVEMRLSCIERCLCESLSVYWLSWCDVTEALGKERGETPLGGPKAGEWRAAHVSGIGRKGAVNAGRSRKQRGNQKQGKKKWSRRKENERKDQREA